MQKIAIIDLDTGNLESVRNMLKKVGCPSVITRDVDEIMAATKLILPGVGAFDVCMKKLEEYKLIPVLEKKVLEEKTPILGICLGMQIMTQRSEEGTMQGLNWIKGEVVKFDFRKLEDKFRIPHMGWNRTEIVKSTPLTEGLPDELKFYFVHSYHFVAENSNDVLFETQYGYPFASGFENENIIGVQFHPEKSHKFGKEVLRNFIEKY